MPEKEVLGLKPPLRFEEVDDEGYDEARIASIATDDARFYLSPRIRSDEVFGRDRLMMADTGRRKRPIWPLALSPIECADAFGRPAKSCRRRAAKRSTNPRLIRIRPEISLHDALVPAHVVGRAVGDDLAIIKHDDLVGKVGHHLHVVFDPQDRDCHFVVYS